MAYGKDPKGLGQAGSFRQRANQYQHQKDKQRKRGGGGGGVYWIGQYKPSIDDVDTIRVIEGHYEVPQVVGEGKDAKVEMVELPFFPYAEHYDGREEKSAICSAGPFAGSKEKADPCHGCKIFWDGMERDASGKKKAGRMSRREMYVFTVLDYGIYHEVNQVDRKTGQVRMNENTGKPYTEWTKCEGQGCDACRSGATTRRGARRHWSLGWGHYQTLLDADKQIGKSCSNCRGVNTVRCIAWICQGCGDAIVDMSTTTLKAKDIDELTSKPVACSCGHRGFAQEMIECGQCTPAGGTAKRATIFDVDMNVKRVQSSDGGNQTSLQISQWSAPCPIDPTFKEFSEPLDLPKIYAPTPLDKQRELFKVPADSVLQRTPVTSGEVSRPYGQQQAPQNPYQQPQGGPAPMVSQSPPATPGVPVQQVTQGGIPGLPPPK